MDESKKSQKPEERPETVQPVQGTEKKKKKKKEKKPPSRLRVLLGRVIALVVTVFLVVGAVYLVANRDKLNVDALRRAISYRASGRTQATVLTYDAAPAGAVAPLDGGILVCSQTGLQMVARNGETVIDETVAMTQPVISVTGGYAVAYDAGGSALYLIHDREITYSYTAEGDQGILAARVSEDGWLTIVEQASGYKAAVTVYNAAFNPVVTENISSAFITDAILSPDHQTLAAVAIGEDDTGFYSTVIFYQVSDGTERSRCGLSNDVVLDLKWEGDTLWAAGEYGVYCIREEAVAGSSVDSSRYLRSFSLGGDGFAAMYYSKYQSGSAGSITLLREDGTEQSIGINDEVLDVSAAGSYLAVLTSSELTIYKSDLTVYASASNSWGARRVLMRADGSALLVTAESASLYLPG